MNNQTQRKDQVDIFAVGQPGVGLDDNEILAIQLCWEGKANDGQQRIAMTAIIDKIARADFLAYQPGSFDGSSFLAGRSYVGKQIRSTLKIKLGDKNAPVQKPRVRRKTK